MNNCLVSPEVSREGGSLSQKQAPSYGITNNGHEYDTVQNP